MIVTRRVVILSLLADFYRIQPNLDAVDYCLPSDFVATPLNPSYPCLQPTEMGVDILDDLLNLPKIGRDLLEMAQGRALIPRRRHLFALML